jgi:hypothetical protein
MAKPARVDFCITARAKLALERSLSQITSYPAVPGLTWGTRSDLPSGERWLIGYYDRRTVETDEFPGFIISTSGLQLVLPQAHLLPRLEKTQLDWADGLFNVIPRSEV